MALITVAHSQVSPEQLTRTTILERFLRETSFGEYGTATGGSTSTLIDTTALKSTQYSSEKYVGWWVRISYNASGVGTAPETEIAPVTSYDPATGTLAFNPVMTAAVAAGDKYQVFSFIHPQRILDTLNQILQRECYLPTWSALSECPDGDMEGPGIFLDWAGTNATVTKDATDPVANGRLQLKVVNTSDAGYASSAIFYATPSRTYHVSALGRLDPTTGTQAKMVIYDETNSAALETVTSTSTSFVRLWERVTLPATCKKFSVRLGGAATSDITFWDDVVVFEDGANDIALPWWVTHRDQVKGFYRPMFMDTDAANAWAPWPRLRPDLNRWDIIDNAFGRDQLRLQARQGSLTDPVYIFGTRAETAYVNDNVETKGLDENFINAHLCFAAFRQLLNDPTAAEKQADWVRKQFAYWRDESKQETRIQMQRSADLFRAATEDSAFYSKGWGV